MCMCNENDAEGPNLVLMVRNDKLVNKNDMGYFRKDFTIVKTWGFFIEKQHVGIDHITMEKWDFLRNERPKTTPRHRPYNSEGSTIYIHIRHGQLCIMIIINLVQQECLTTTKLKL